jgi:hypothetical protein
MNSIEVQNDDSKREFVGLFQKQFEIHKKCIKKSQTVESEQRENEGCKLIHSLIQLSSPVV